MKSSCFPSCLISLRANKINNKVPDFAYRVGDSKPLASLARQLLKEFSVLGLSSNRTIAGVITEVTECTRQPLRYYCFSPGRWWRSQRSVVLDNVAVAGSHNQRPFPQHARRVHRVKDGGLRYPPEVPVLAHSLHSSLLSKKTCKDFPVGVV